MLRLILLLLFSAQSFAINQGTPSAQLLQRSVIKIQFLWKMSPDMPCTGVIISSYTLITAAHCVDKISLKSALYMVHGKNKFSVESIYVPLEYYPAIKKYHNPPSGGNLMEIHRGVAQFDIAVVNLKIPFNSYYRPIGVNYDDLHAGVKITTVGAGKVKRGSKNLHTNLAYQRHGKLQILPLGVYLVKGKNLNDPITSPGDSGGALLYKNKLIGIIRGSSFNKSEAATIYTPLRKHQSFINKYIKKK